jgi:hypothetical protein
MTVRVLFVVGDLLVSTQAKVVAHDLSLVAGLLAKFLSGSLPTSYTSLLQIKSFLCSVTAS